jgi:hypothetical protein
LLTGDAGAATSFMIAESTFSAARRPKIQNWQGLTLRDGPE